MIDKFKSLIFTKICLVAVFLSVSSFQGYGQGVVSRKGKTTVTSKSKVSRTNKSNVSAPDGYINGHGYVDLGLSVKWATCNIGATKVSEVGNFYAWGETITKDKYDAENYKYCKDTVRYNTGEQCGGIYIWTDGSFMDIGQDISSTCYDPAYTLWGKDWHIPTKENFNELIEKCKWSWCTIGGVKGFVVTGPNGKNIFLPAKYWEIYNSWSQLYWTSSVVCETNRVRAAWKRAWAFLMGTDQKKHEMTAGWKIKGYPIRPVTNN